MEFKKVSLTFKEKVSEILDSAQLIEEDEIKAVAEVLIKYARTTMKSAEIKVFLENVLLYFVFLNKYARQFTKISALQHYAVRKALGVLMFIVDSTQIYTDIIRTLRKIVDVVLETEPQSSNIKEFLRIYSHMLDKVPADVLKKLAVKHKAYPILFRILKETSDIETQVVIMEVVSKLFQSSDDMQLDDTFQKMIQITANGSELNIYENIRMSINYVNELSTNIFSISCSKIQLGFNRVTGFYGISGADDNWLDVNLIENKITIFCDKKSIAFLDKMKLYSPSPWEVLSFCTEDVSHTAFSYNAAGENLVIKIMLENSSFDVFVVGKKNNLRLLEISVSKHSNGFYKFVQDILPKIFSKSFSVDLLNIPEKKSDSSKTVSDLFNYSAADSSPVIEQFKVLNKVSTRNNSSPILISESDRSDSDSIVLISDDENDKSLQKNRPKKVAVFSKNFNTACSDVNRNSEQRTICESVLKLSKMSTNRKDKNKFNKSVSPLSFTESVFTRAKRSLSRSSKSSEQNFVSTKKQGKCSALEKTKSHEISKTKNKSKTKISTSLMSPVVRKESKSGIKKKKGNKKIKQKKSECIVEEYKLDKGYDDDLFDDNLNSSMSKVKNWLEKVDHSVVFNGEVEKEMEIQSLPDMAELELGDLPAVSTGNSCNMAPEEKMELLMGENVESEKGEKRDQPERRTSDEDLIKILSSDHEPETALEHNENVQETVGLDNLNSANENLQLNEEEKCASECGSRDSDLPLVDVAKKLTQNNDQIEDANNNISQEQSPKGENKPLSKYHEDNFCDLEEKVLPLNKSVVEAENVHNSTIDEASADVTPDLDLEVPNSSVLPPKKRKLYTPGDVSFLNASITEEYLKSRGPIEISPNETKSPKLLQVKAKNAKGKEKINRRSRGTAKTDSPSTRAKKLEIKTKIREKINRKLQDRGKGESPLTDVTKQESPKKLQLRTRPVDSLNSLKEKFRNLRKERKKKERQLRGKNSASSSSSSMVPFGVALREARKKKSAPVTGPNAKSPKMEVENNEKIRIISNIVIQPGFAPPKQETYKSLLKLTTQYYLEYIQTVHIAQPDLMRNDDFGQVEEVLQRWVDM